MKKILVTGSEGYLASRFIDYYKDTYTITALNRKTLDITNEHEVFNHFKTHHYDIIFHSAAISDTGTCQHNPQLAELINTFGTLNIAKGCAMQKSTLIFASSDQIFNGNQEDGPYSEYTIPNPQTVYAHSKLNAEKAISATLEHYYNLRLTWLFSLPERNKKINPNILMNLYRALLQNSSITLSDNEFRGMTYVYDVIERVEKLLHLPYGNYNFGSENDYSTYDIGRFILDSIGLPHRSDELLIRDTERFKDKKRDLRICSPRLKEKGVYFPTTSQSLLRCLKDFNA